MADYCAQADLERAAGGAARLAKVADQDSNGVADPTVITEAIDDAERWIDSYLARRYSVPLESPSDIIRRVCAEEAVYLLNVNAGTVGNVEGVFAAYQARHIENLQWLEGVAAGKINPGVDPPPAKSSAVTATSGDRSSVTGAVTRSSLERFV